MTDLGHRQKMTDSIQLEYCFAGPSISAFDPSYQSFSEGGLQLCWSHLPGPQSPDLYAAAKQPAFWKV